MGARIWTLARVLNLWSNSLAIRRGLYIFYILSYLLCYVLFEETGFSLKFCIFEFDLVTLWWHFLYSIIHYVNCQFLKYILNMFHLVCVCVWACAQWHACEVQRTTFRSLFILYLSLGSRDKTRFPDLAANALSSWALSPDLNWRCPETYSVSAQFFVLPVTSYWAASAVSSPSVCFRCFLFHFFSIFLFWLSTIADISQVFKPTLDGKMTSRSWTSNSGYQASWQQVPLPTKPSYQL